MAVCMHIAINSTWSSCKSPHTQTLGPSGGPVVCTRVSSVFVFMFHLLACSVPMYMRVCGWYACGDTVCTCVCVCVCVTQVHLHTDQAASAFQYLTASINLKPDFAHRCEPRLQIPTRTHTHTYTHTHTLHSWIWLVWAAAMSQSRDACRAGPYARPRWLRQPNMCPLAVCVCVCVCVRVLQFSYMYLAIALSRLGDPDNASAAYKKAMQVAGAPGEAVFHLNYGTCVCACECVTEVRCRHCAGLCASWCLTDSL